VRRGPARERGGVFVAFAVFAVVWIRIMGMVLDLGQAFNRRAELQEFADNAALAGAFALNGTPAGIAVAANAVRSRPGQVRYGPGIVRLPDSAISFSTSPDTPDPGWKSVAAATAAPAGLLFMRVDARSAATPSDVQLGRISTSFMRLIAPGVHEMLVGGEAVAGRFAQASAIVQLYR
jgi:Flp pilus assembly protein TadG